MIHTQKLELKPELVHSVSSRFYSRNGKTCVQILVSYGEKRETLCKEFEDFSKYQSEFDELVNHLNSKDAFEVELMALA